MGGAAYVVHGDERSGVVRWPEVRGHLRHLQTAGFPGGVHRKAAVRQLGFA
jgi:hypothetical protein